MQVNDVIVEWAEIPSGERGTRRQREREAVVALLERLLPGITLEHDAEGAPVVEGWHISITHSLRLAAVAICKEHPIGIDAEEWRDALSKVKDKYLSDSEKEWASEADYLALWTAKEAVFKAAHQPGLSFTDITVNPSKTQATASSTASSPASSHTSSAASSPAYSLTYLSLGPTLLALASPLN